MKILASRLNNKIEIKRAVIVSGKLGDKREYQTLKKVWADIIPLTGKVNSNQDGTQYTNLNFKIIMRKNDIKQSDIICYKENTYEIDYIIPAFNKNNYIEVFAHIKKEFYGEVWWYF